MRHLDDPLTRRPPIWKRLQDSLELSEQSILSGRKLLIGVIVILFISTMTIGAVALVRQHMFVKESLIKELRAQLDAMRSVLETIDQEIIERRKEVCERGGEERWPLGERPGTCEWCERRSVRQRMCLWVGGGGTAYVGQPSPRFPS